MPKHPKLTKIHRDLLRSIGDGRQVSELIRDRTGQTVPPHTVGVWRYRGIPWKWRSAIKDICSERNIAVPAGFVIEGGAAS